MKPTERKVFRCAIYTRKSTEHNLDLECNSLDAQREACEAYIKSQAHEGWRLIRTRYDDGGLSGASGIVCYSRCHRPSSPQTHLLLSQERLAKRDSRRCNASM